MCKSIHCTDKLNQYNIIQVFQVGDTFRFGDFKNPFPECEGFDKLEQAVSFIERWGNFYRCRLEYFTINSLIYVKDSYLQSYKYAQFVQGRIDDLPYLLIQFSGNMLEECLNVIQDSWDTFELTKLMNNLGYVGNPNFPNRYDKFVNQDLLELKKIA